MPFRLDTRDADFSERFRSLLDAKREASEDVAQAVAGIVADVIACVSTMKPTPKIIPARLIAMERFLARRKRSAI